MPFGLDEVLWDSLLRALALGEYHLLLGAGASMTALDYEGTPLPSAPDLAKELIDRFGIPAEGQTIGLGRAYEAAMRRRNDNGVSVHEYLATRFSGCQPPSWYSAISTNRWAWIWSLNIDDVVEQSYRKWTGDRSQSPVSISWTDPYRVAGENQVLVSHLHGVASLALRGTANSELVFDIVEYLKAADHRHSWHHIFADSFSTKPFIIVGARLGDEYDLAQIVRRGNRSTELQGLPSVIVLREVSQLQREEFREWGLVPIEADAGLFFSALSSALPKFRQELALTTPGSPTSLPNEAVSFLQQFVWLKIDSHDHTDSKHDLYAGQDPIWDDILHERDAQFGVVDRVLDSVSEGSQSQAVFCIWGPRFTGKSTAMLRIAQRLIVTGYDVFSFRAEEQLDIRATVWWLKRSARPVALIIDGLADWAPDTGCLATQCRDLGIRLVVIGTERGGRRDGARTGRVERLYAAVSAEFLRIDKEFEVAQLSDDDIDLLLTKLREGRRLGKISGLPPAEQQLYFARTSKRQLFGGMAGLEGGKGFRDRLWSQYAGISKKECRQAYVVCCMSYALGYPVPFSILCSTVGISSSEFVRALAEDEQLAEVMEMDHRGVKPRHRTVASMMVEMQSKETVFDLSLSLAKQLSPYITPATITQRTLPYQISRELMDHELIRWWVGKDRVERWYESLVAMYGWNARFWEQRALAETILGQFDKAESYAENAVKLHRDPFTLNTLGTVLMRKAIEWCEPGSTSAWEYYWRSVRELHDSREVSNREYQHPYITFFRYTLRFAETAALGAPLQSDDRMVAEWHSWERDARTAPPFAHDGLYRQLEELHRRWLLLHV